VRAAQATRDAIKLDTAPTRPARAHIWGRWSAHSWRSQRGRAGWGIRIRNAEKISALVQTVINAVKDILAGNVSALAAKVEAVLASTIPIVLDFLATLIGIGSKITETIQKALKAVTQPIQDAIDSVLIAIKNAVGGFIDRLLGKGKPGEAPAEVAPGTPMTTEQIIAAVVPKLSEPTKSTDPAEALEEKKKQAEELKKTFQPSAPEGKTLKITFTDRSAEQVADDREVDMEVGFSPGTEVKAPLSDDFWPAKLEPRTKFPPLVELDRLEKERGTPAADRAPSRYLNDFENVYAGEQDLDKYLNQRASRKLGRMKEGPAIAAYSAHPLGIPGTIRQTILVEQPSGAPVERIPDLFKDNIVVGDVKDVEEQSLDAQMRDNVRIRQGKGRLRDGTPVAPLQNFHLLVRISNDQHPKGTRVFGPLRAVLTAPPFEVIP